MNVIVKIRCKRMFDDCRLEICAIWQRIFQPQCHAYHEYSIEPYILTNILN